MSETDFNHMTGADLKSWRRINRYSQEQLKITLDLGSRQTIVNWEKSTKKLPRMLCLALMALEHSTDKAYRDGGKRAQIAEYKFSRDRTTSGSVESPPRRPSTPIPRERADRDTSPRKKNAASR